MKLTGINFTNSDTCRGVSFVGGDAPLDLAEIEISGRYPENGWARNRTCHEMVRVLSGTGSLMIRDSEVTKLIEGDVVHVAPNTWFAWSGNMTILMACSPAFNPGQYETKELDALFTISEMTIEDVEPIAKMHAKSWLDTYPNAEHGVTEEWIRQRMESRLTPEGLAKKREAFLERQQRGEISYVAKDHSGAVIGFAGSATQDGRQKLTTIYVDKAWHGGGVSQALMQKVLHGFDLAQPVWVSVVSYNERAKAFYRKWGFEEVPDSKRLFDDKIPEVQMIRKADQGSRV